MRNLNKAGTTVSITILGMMMFAACSDHSLSDKSIMPGASLRTASIAGGSSDGTAAPSMPSASDVFAAEPVPESPKAAKGGTDDMKKTLSTVAEETQMPLVGHGNNHSAPDSASTASTSSAVPTAPPKKR